MYFHGCSSGQLYLVWQEETNYILFCGKQKFSKFRVFITWIICFEHGFLHMPPLGAGAQEVQCGPLQAVVTQSHARQLARQPMQ